MAEELHLSHLERFIDPILAKKLFAHALLIDIDDNNKKVDIVKQLLGPQFAELAPGTNRYSAMGPDGYCYKIALDRRGIVDNVTEFRRSPAIEWCAPKVYECNGVVNITETVQLITREQFIANKENVLTVCEELSKDYIFEDIGFAGKNFCNWGIRPRNGDLVILDTGYMIPKLGNDEAMRCPVCGEPLRYNGLYTGFLCSSSRCNTEFRFIDVYRRLNRSFDDEIFEAISGFDLPDFDSLNDRLYNNTMMKGGHIYYEPDEDDGDDDHGDIVRTEDILEILNRDILDHH